MSDPVEPFLSVRDAIAQLTLVASGLPDGLDSAFKVSMCHGEGHAAEFTAHVEITQWHTIGKQSTRPTRSYVVAQGHPHRDPEYGTLQPWVPPDLADEPGGEPQH